MAYFEMLPFYLLPLLVIDASASCSDLSHSECELRATSAVVLLAIQLPEQQNCRKLCESIGEGCKFFTFEEESFHQNCQLYRQSMSAFISHRCNVIGGTKEANFTCDYDALEKDQLLEAQCQYDAVVEEQIKTNSWEHCQQFCSKLSQCGAWEFLKEEQMCHILGSSQKKCLVNMGAYAPYTQCETDCILEDNMDYAGTDIHGIHSGYGSKENCAKLCGETEGCEFWTFVKSSQGCWLKEAGAVKKPSNCAGGASNCISGTKGCAIMAEDRPPGLPSSCLAMSHSECDMRDCNVLLALQLDGEANCQAMCEAIGEGCKFFTFEENSYHENCQLYTIEMAKFMETCNVLGGGGGGDLCDYSRMRSGDVVEGQCQYGVVEERMSTETWQSCQRLSRGGWKYFKEEKSCHLLGSQHKNCLVKFGVADPYNKCGGGTHV